jgi:hypothetical protein
MKSEATGQRLMAALLLFLLLQTASSQMGFTQQASVPDKAPSLHKFLLSYLGASDEDRANTRYLSATVDLNGDGQRENVVYLLGNDWCGSGGCTMLILTTQNAHYKVITRATITRLPIRLLSTRTNGWRDLAVTVAGGGILKAYEAKLTFNGRKYPGNPTVAPAVKLPANTPGTILIREDAGSHAIPLYR